MTDFLNRKQDITWRSPKGTAFILKTNESGYKRKHIGEVKENPKTTVKSGTTVSSKKKGSNVSHSAGVSRSQSSKVVGDSNDTFSDLGVSGRDMSLECLFIGNSHDTDAQKFINALCEVGKSHLRLVYGDEFTVNVIDFEVKNELTKNVNLTTVTVNFHETAKTTYPSSSSGGKKQVKNAAAQTKKISAQNLSDALDDVALSSDTGRLAKFSTSYSGMMSNVSDKLSTASNVSLNSIMTDVLGQDVTSNALTMTSQLQIVMSKAASLAYKTTNLNSEFSLDSSFGSAFGSWGTLVSSLISSSTPTSGSSNLKKSEIDTLLINDTAATSALAALSENLVDAQFDTRKEAVEAAKSLSELEETWTNHVEEQANTITDLDDVFIRDTGISDVVAQATGEILKQSYELKVEKTLILSEDKSIIELAYENYPDAFSDDPDGTVGYLISSNKFADDEFFLLPKGSEVKIYV